MRRSSNGVSKDFFRKGMALVLALVMTVKVRGINVILPLSFLIFEV
jgi:hypothetical protein